MNTNQILEATSGGWDIYEHYYRQSPFYKGRPLVLNRKNFSPFREEKKPSFSVHPHRDRGKAELWYNDFGDPDRNATGNAFTFVGYMFGFTMDRLGFPRILAKIKQEVLGLGAGEAYVPGQFTPKAPPRELREQKELLFETVPYKRAWTGFDLLHFAQILVTRPGVTRGQAKELAEYWLNRYFVFPVTRYCSILGTNRRYHWATLENPIYVIWFPRTNRAKIYRPFAPDPADKWRSNVKGEEDLFGFHLLPESCENLFLTAGNTDTMAFAAWTGLPCFPLNSETASIDFIKPVLSRMARNIFTVMNNDFNHRNKKTGLIDNTGLKVEKRLLAEHGYQPANAFLKKFASNDVAEFIRQSTRQGEYQRLENVKQYLLTLHSKPQYV